MGGVSSFFCFFVFFCLFLFVFLFCFLFCFCFSCSYLSNYDFHLKATFPFKYDIWFHFVNLLCLLSKDTMIHQTAHCQLKRREGSAQFYTTTQRSYSSEGTGKTVRVETICRTRASTNQNK